MRVRGGAILTLDAADTIYPEGEVVIERDRLTYVGPSRGAPPAAPHEEVIDATGRVVIPGLIQAHVHLCQTLFRNQADDLALLDWLRERIWPFEAAHDPASLRASADLGTAELIRSGTTAILDMGTVRHTDAIFESARASGLRATIGKCHMDADSGQPEPLAETTEGSLREAIALAERWHESEGGRLRYAFAPRFVLSCTEDLLRGVVAEAWARGLLVHTHASENADEHALVRARTGHDNVAYFDAIGLLGPNAVLAHCIHVSDHELSLLARRGAHVAHCPSSNLKLGSGIAPIPEMLERGINVAIGADGAPCNNNLDALWEMRLAALIQKPRRGPRAMPARRALDLATRGGARALGLADDLGSLERGKKADLAILDLQDVATAPGADPYAQIVYAAQSRHVTDVLIDGRVVLRDRRLVTLDEERVLARAIEERAALERRLVQ